MIGVSSGNRFRSNDLVLSLLFERSISLYLAIFGVSNYWMIGLLETENEGNYEILKSNPGYVYLLAFVFILFSKGFLLKFKSNC